MNRTPKGKQEFVDLLVDVLAFTAKKHPEHTRKSLNALSYKGKIQLKDTSKDELARFARAAYADTQFMSRSKSTGIIVMSLIASFFVSDTVLALPTYYVTKALRQNRIARDVFIILRHALNILRHALNMGATYFLSRSAFRQNASRLDAIIRKH